METMAALSHIRALSRMIDNLVLYLPAKGRITTMKQILACFGSD